MTEFTLTDKNRVRRMPTRGAYDTATIYPIVDAALICHVGMIYEGEPIVIPTLHARREDEILLHGATTSRLLQYAMAGHPLCVTVTLVDGLVLSLFNRRQLQPGDFCDPTATLVGVAAPGDEAAGMRVRRRAAGACRRMRTVQ